MSDSERPKFVNAGTQVSAVVPATHAHLPPPPPQLTEAQIAALPAPLVAEAPEGWSVRVGENLTRDHADIGELMRECSGLSFSRGKLVAAHARAEHVDMIDPDTLERRRIDLPKGGALLAAGLKAGAQLQLEAVVAAKDWRGDFLLAFGAGTTDDVRRVVRMRVGSGELDLSVVEARWLYKLLYDLPGFATSTLNVEGVCAIRAAGAPAVIRLCQRGNGRPRGEVRVTSATVDIRQDVLIAYLERCRKNADAQLGDDLVNVRRYDLGWIDGVQLSISDAAGLPDGRMLYVAAAERSLEVGLPGKNYGTALGVIEADGRARYSLIREDDGTPTLAKAAALSVDDRNRVYVALQAARGEAPRLCRLAIEGLPIVP